MELQDRQQEPNTTPVVILHRGGLLTSIARLACNVSSDYYVPVGLEQFPSLALPRGIHLNFINLKLLKAAWNVFSGKQDMYLSHIQRYKEVIHHAKSAYCTSIIESTEGNTRTLFSSLYTIVKPLPYIHPLLQSVTNLWTFLY